MKGYVERLEWLEKCSDAPVGYDEVLDSFRNDADMECVDAPRPQRGLCRRCLRTLAVTLLIDGVCADRYDCSRALMRLHHYRKGIPHG